jgi:8-oxo-dGTP pyrophosphatase MutT (NUDIX family)
VTGAPQIAEVAELDLAYDPAPWPFAEAQADRIAAHWAELRAQKPALFNGRVLLLGRRAFRSLPGGGARLGGACFETDYASFVAWRDWGRPDESVANCFSMAALQGADGAFLLGEMAAHTLNAGRVYFPSGSPDPSDVADGRVDLDGSALRELREETGLLAEETEVASGWTVVSMPGIVACLKRMRLAVAADEAKARIEAFLASDPHAELARMHVVRAIEEIDRLRTPVFVSAYLETAFAE